MAIAYKLLKMRKNGTLGSLFINCRQVIPIGKWLKAEAHRKKGYAFRPGWHATPDPVAPHLSKKNRIWCKVEVKDYELLNRPENQGGTWYLAKKMRVLEVMPWIDSGQR